MARSLAEIRSYVRSVTQTRGQAGATDSELDEHIRTAYRMVSEYEEWDYLRRQSVISASTLGSDTRQFYLLPATSDIRRVTDVWTTVPNTNSEKDLLRYIDYPLAANEYSWERSGVPTAWSYLPAGVIENLQANTNGAIVVWPHNGQRIVVAWIEEPAVWPISTTATTDTPPDMPSGLVQALELFAASGLFSQLATPDQAQSYYQKALALLATHRKAAFPKSGRAWERGGLNRGNPYSFLNGYLHPITVDQGTGGLPPVYVTGVSQDGLNVAVSRAGTSDPQPQAIAIPNQEPDVYVTNLSLSGQNLTVAREGKTDPADQTITLPSGGGGGSTVTPHTPTTGDQPISGLDISNTDYEIVDAAARSQQVLNEAFLSHLEDKTHDLIPSLENQWSDASSSQGGLATSTTVWTDSALSNATYNQSNNTAATRYLVARRNNTVPANRLRIVLTSGSIVRTILLSSLTSRTVSGITNFTFYELGSQIDSNTTAELEYSDDTDHVGSSTFAGNLVQGKVQSALGAYVDDGSFNNGRLTLSRPNTSDVVINLPDEGTTVRPHNPESGDTELPGLTIGSDDFVIIDDRSWARAQTNSFFLDFVNDLTTDFTLGTPVSWTQAGIDYGGLHLFAAQPSDNQLTSASYTANQVLTVNSTNRWLGIHFDSALARGGTTRYRVQIRYASQYWHIPIANLRAQTTSGNNSYYVFPHQLPEGAQVNVQEENVDTTGKADTGYRGNLAPTKTVQAVENATEAQKSELRASIGASAGVGHLLDDMSVTTPPSTTQWRPVNSNGNEGGIAFTGLTNPSLGSAAAATYDAPTDIPSTTVVHYILIRIPVGQEANRWQVACTNFGMGVNPLLLSQFRRIGADTNWQYFVSSPHATAGAIVRLNTTSDAHHLGTTTYSGTLNTESVLDSIEDFTDAQITAAKTALEITSGGGASLSDNTPQGPGTAAAGTGTSASRDDHVHPRQTEITSTEIKNSAITNAKINDNAISNAKILVNTIDASKLNAAARAQLARIPTASPAANRVWGTGSTGGPTWIEQSAGRGYTALTATQYAALNPPTAGELYLITGP